MASSGGVGELAGQRPPPLGADPEVEGAREHVQAMLAAPIRVVEEAPGDPRDGLGAFGVAIVAHARPAHGVVDRRGLLGPTERQQRVGAQERGAGATRGVEGDVGEHHLGARGLVVL